MVLLLWQNNTPTEVFQKKFSFQTYLFEVETNASGAVRDLKINVLRDKKPLITIRQKIDGWVTAAAVADLDKNNSPEIYIYACSYGSGAFGKVYGFQFYPTNFLPINMTPLTAQQSSGYMGHDNFKIENGVLVRRFPVYRAGDSNAQPTGGARKIEYTLKEVNKKLLLSVSKVE
jgi:hypothetical protein